ncbi:hypothetical protein [Bradyrhizobium sp. OAE829]|uniref:hypothetical protein n=1 Tax=Bradyrhizobium sp. OAE829 TaxID=2663807 RepID=UPI00178A8265
MGDYTEMSLTSAEISRFEQIRAGDHKFFERFPHRHYRFRLAGRVEIKCASMGGAIPNPLPASSKYYAMVVNNYAAARILMVYAIGPEGLDTDVSEAEARAYFEATNRRDASRMAELELSCALSVRNA